VETDISRLNNESLKALQDYALKILDHHRSFNELRNKAETIDTAYYRYQTDTDREAGTEECGITVDNMVVPVVVSQVDSFVGYFSEVYLSGYPTFPVISSPKDIKLAEKLEAIIDQHATLGGYSRELLQAFYQGTKYNFMPILCESKRMPSYDLVAQLLSTKDAAKLKMSEKKYTCLRNLSVYNTIWDNRFRPTEVATRGDFVGHVDRLSRGEVRVLLAELFNKKAQYNRDKTADLPSGSINSVNYTDLPQVSQYISSSNQNSRTGTTPDWDQYFGGRPNNMQSRGALRASIYELATIQVRLIPQDYGIQVPAPSLPQIFKLHILNGQLLVGFERVITPYNSFTINIGQPLEDNFGIQTPSIAERQGGWQAAATALFNIRIAMARRAVSDRGIFDADVINPTDINSKHPAAKIPARLKGLQDKKIQDAYYSIPYNPSGVEGVVNDMSDIMRFADQTSGLNAPQRGQFQKGNKSVDEWRDTMGSADNRLRLPALNMEFQSFIPIKEMIKFNIFMNGEAGTFTNYSGGDALEVTSEDIQQMQAKSLTFRIADGFTPKSKMASTDFLATGIQMLSTSQVLQAYYGGHLPSMFAHMMQLGGVRGLDEYSPDVATAEANQQATQQAQGVPNGQPAAPAAPIV